jgi:hypothetical protein
VLGFQGLVLSVVEKAETFIKRGFCQVRSKEMNEKRMNHCRGVVTNSVVVQNRRGQRPEGTSHVNVTCKLS